MSSKPKLTTATTRKLNVSTTTKPTTVIPVFSLCRDANSSASTGKIHLNKTYQTTPFPCVFDIVAPPGWQIQISCSVVSFNNYTSKMTVSRVRCTTFRWTFCLKCDCILFLIFSSLVCRKVSCYNPYPTGRIILWRTLCRCMRNLSDRTNLIVNGTRRPRRTQPNFIVNFFFFYSLCLPVFELWQHYWYNGRVYFSVCRHGQTSSANGTIQPIAGNSSESPRYCSFFILAAPGYQIEFYCSAVNLTSSGSVFEVSRLFKSTHKAYISISN